MNRTVIEVGAFSWARIQRLYDADPIVHWQRCEAEGLPCPQDVFAQLFHAEDVGLAPPEGAERRGGPNLLERAACVGGRLGPHGSFEIPIRLGRCTAACG